MSVCFCNSSEMEEIKSINLTFMCVCVGGDLMKSRKVKILHI